MMVVVDQQECTGCGICVDACPAEAITLVDGVARVNREECTGCLTCVDECPAEAISED
jgi:Fe-S-cluster-containing hydrogenase component 2